jgi:hypothetical protein
MAGLIGLTGCTWVTTGPRRRRLLAFAIIIASIGWCSSPPPSVDWAAYRLTWWLGVTISGSPPVVGCRRTGHAGAHWFVGAPDSLMPQTAARAHRAGLRPAFAKPGTAPRSRRCSAAIRSGSSDPPLPDRPERGGGRVHANGVSIKVADLARLAGARACSGPCGHIRPIGGHCQAHSAPRSLGLLRRAATKPVSHT